MGVDAEVKETVRIRLYAAARSAAGQGEISVAPGRLDLILDVMAIDNSRLKQVFAQCSFLLDGVALHDKDVMIPAHSTVDILPPFAGG